MPFVLDGGFGRVEIAAHGQRDEITFSVDPIRQEPVIVRKTHPTQDVKNGTVLRVWWPDSACSILHDARDKFLQLADDYTFLNPHLTLTVDWFGGTTRIQATNPAWKKWVPSEPTSPHWYDLEHLERLIAAYVAHDQDRRSDRSVREFVKEFRGLTGTAKQKAVLEATGLARKNLSTLADGDGLRHDLTETLLSAMREHSKAVKPAALGVIGKDHLAKRFADMGCQMDSFQHAKVTEIDDGLPVVIETAFGWRGDECRNGRRIVTGVNWSPGIHNLFRTLGRSYGDGLGALLEKRYAGEEVMEDAYNKASNNGKYPALARQIMYAARGRILELVDDCHKLDSNYFTQTLLPGYI